jgi:uncharacterized membrane protein YdbT with pleckstrin-like domain
MKCPACDRECADDMSLCGYCGASLSKAAARLAPPPAPAEGEEKVVWKGGFSARAVAHHWILYLLCVGLLIFAWFQLPGEVRQNPIALYVAAALGALPLLVLLLRILIKKLGYRYELTEDYLYIYRGILIRHKDTTPLYRIDDLKVIQSLANRLFGVGAIYVTAPTDQSDDELLIEGILDPHGVEKKIRDLVRRHKRGSIRMEEI